jgi:hypothetical protein
MADERITDEEVATLRQLVNAQTIAADTLEDAATALKRFQRQLAVTYTMRNKDECDAFGFITRKPA